jgi:hypothetical protein
MMPAVGLFQTSLLPLMRLSFNKRIQINEKFWTGHRFKHLASLFRGIGDG